MFVRLIAGQKTKAELHLSNYPNKSEVKKATDAYILEHAKEFDLSCLK